MQSTLSCPGCGSQVSEGQQFCGICGRKLAGTVQQQANTCPGCGSPISAEQQFCGVCGTKLAGVGEQQTVPAQQPVTEAVTAKATPVEAGAAPSEFGGPPEMGGAPQPVATAPETMAAPQAAAGAPQTTGFATSPIEAAPLPAAGLAMPSLGDIAVSPRKRRVLRVAAIIFQIFGWIVLVGGCLVSIAMAVFAGLGGQFVPVFPGITSFAGTTAIGMAIGGIVASLLYGFGFLAFAELCYAVIEIEKTVTI